MYAQAAFRMDRAASLRFAAARGFGLVVACDGGRPIASPLPFHLSYRNDGSPRVAFHVARGNPLAALAAHGGSWLLAVSGADTYVSPDWYLSADQVPTWLYETVQLNGTVAVMPPARLGEHLDRLSETFESWLAPKPPWSSDKVTPARLEALKTAIVGIEMTVETVEGSAKLNQNKTDADYAGVVAHLRRDANPASRSIAERMIALRPDLTYE